LSGCKRYGHDCHNDKIHIIIYNDFLASTTLLQVHRFCCGWNC
jgi:hypothetical protein